MAGGRLRRFEGGFAPVSGPDRGFFAWVV